jgi:tRNA U34 2-thiouridine synthase MnmA/TrmU
MEAARAVARRFERPGTAAVVARSSPWRSRNFVHGNLSNGAVWLGQLARLGPGVRGVAPGQAAVFYAGDEVMGGGRIALC